MTTERERAKPGTVGSLALDLLGVLAGGLLASTRFIVKDERGGFLILLGVTLLWVLVRRRTRKVAGDRSGRLLLALLSLVLGPLVAGLMGIAYALAFEPYLDQAHTIVSFTALGLIAGVVLSLTFALGACIVPKSPAD